MWNWSVSKWALLQHQGAVNCPPLENWIWLVNALAVENWPSKPENLLNELSNASSGFGIELLSSSQTLSWGLHFKLSFQKKCYLERNP